MRKKERGSERGRRIIKGLFGSSLINLEENKMTTRLLDYIWIFGLWDIPVICIYVKTNIFQRILFKVKNPLVLTSRNVSLIKYMIAWLRPGFDSRLAGWLTSPPDRPLTEAFITGLCQERQRRPAWEDMDGTTSTALHRGVTKLMSYWWYFSVLEVTDVTDIAGKEITCPGIFLDEGRMERRVVDEAFNRWHFWWIRCPDDLHLTPSWNDRDVIPYSTTALPPEHKETSLSATWFVWVLIPRHPLYVWGIDALVDTDATWMYISGTVISHRSLTSVALTHYVMLALQYSLL